MGDKEKQRSKEGYLEALQRFRRDSGRYRSYETYRTTLDYNTMMKKADEGLVALYSHNANLREMNKKTNELINALNNPSKKEKCVVGQAVAGGIIAGPAGAVVGAINAADKNSKIRDNNSSSGDRSVVKDAVVGGIIAGPAGAVVGAVNAADKNNKIRSEKNK